MLAAYRGMYVAIVLVEEAHDEIRPKHASLDLQLHLPPWKYVLGIKGRISAESLALLSRQQHSGSCTAKCTRSSTQARRKKT